MIEKLHEPTGNLPLPIEVLDATHLIEELSPDEVEPELLEAEAVEAEAVEAEAVEPAPAILPSLVPADVLEELHARGEIELEGAPPVEVGVGVEVLPGNFSLPTLVPSDVLEELHARGEIELFDAEGNPVVLPDELSPDEVELIEDSEIEELLEASPVERVIDAEEVVDALARVPLFSELDQKALAELAVGATLQVVGDRGYVFREGELAETFFLVAEGAVEALRRTRKGEIAMHQFRQGDVFG
ncbi:MAG: cyclic nucleotide-binding domain-containing protein, partial [Myxococcales bacterium]